MVEIGIPVYNAEKTLSKALDSLVAQTKNNFIVCLSIDGDGKYTYYKPIINEYIRRGLKIRVINSKENGGPGAARQRVLDTTQCDYIMYLDADDMFMPRAVEVLYTQAKLGGYDIIRSSSIREEKTKNDMIIQQNVSTVTWFHGKIYKVAYLKDKNIRFLDGLKVDEDAYFNLVAWNCAERRGEANEVTYIWRFNENSITRKLSTKEYFLNTYTDYIRSQVEGLKTLYKINGTHSDSLVCQTLLNIYYYCMKVRYYKANEVEINNLIHSLADEPWMGTFLNNAQNWINISKNIKGSDIYEDDTIVFFVETFNLWAARLLRK